MSAEHRTEGWDEVQVSYIPPYEVGALFAYLRNHIVPGIEEVKNEQYRRSLCFSGVRGLIELSPVEDAPQFRLRLQLEAGTDRALCVERCRNFLDLARDPAMISAVLGRDPLLAPLVAAQPGLRVAGAVDGFELAVRAIVGQQVSVAGACTLVGRMARRLGEPVTPPFGGVTHYFPTPQAVVQGNLDGLGITGSRIAAIRALAGAVAQHDLQLHLGVEREETCARLQALPGIGPWTVQYIAMRALGDTDACPVTDLGLRRALEALGVPGDSRSALIRAESWRPWRAYGVHYLWATLPSQRRAR